MIAQHTNVKRCLYWGFASAAGCLAIGLGGCAERPTAVEHQAPLPSAAAPDSDPLDGQITRPNGKVEVISKRYDIDRPYLPMLGPRSTIAFRLLNDEPAELVWIAGAHVRTVDGDGREPMPNAYLCRADLALDLERHRAIFGFEGDRSDRVLALAAGQLDLEFPPGFGIPIWSDESLTLTTQAQNLDFSPKQKPLHVRQRVTFDLVRQRDLRQPLKPLYLCPVPGLKSLESRATVYDDSDQFPDEALKLSACSPGIALLDTERSDRFARRYTDHWVLEPGREENHTRVTTLLDLAADTTIHSIVAQLHPYAESIELFDLTSGETVFQGAAGQLSGQNGLGQVDGMSSAEGLPVHAGHEYELLSVYNNTSGTQQSAMVRLDLYLLDPQFKVPADQPAAGP